MSFTFIILIGVLLAMLFILFRHPIIEVLGKNNLFKKRLNKTKWFQNHWLSGIFIFFINAFLFFSTGFILYGVVSLTIPYIHLLVMILAVMVSIYFWAVMNQTWQGKKSNRLKMGTIGSSFYLFLAIFLGYKLAILEPLFPGEDTFMRALGLVFAIIVTTVAFATCFIMTGFCKKKVGHRID